MPTTQVGDLHVVWDVAGPEDGDPVLMINGLGAVRGSWEIQVEALAQRYRVYTYDNRDVGETGAGSDPQRYAIRQFARDAEGLIEALEIGPVHVIGASMGGAIAIELALERPDLLRSVQIVCSWAQTDPWLDELFRQWKSMFARMGALAWGRSTWVWVFTHRWFQDPDHLAEPGARCGGVPVPADRRHVRPAVRRRDRLRRLRPPGRAPDPRPRHCRRGGYPDPAPLLRPRSPPPFPARG